MRFIFFHLKKLDWVLTGLVVFLTLIGILSIYVSSFRNNDFLNFKKQIIFFITGFFLMIVFSFFNYRILKNNPYLILTIYFLCLLLLGGLFFFAPEIRGVKSWYKLGYFSFGPIEPTKIVLIILLAKYFSMRHVEMYKFHHIIFSGIYIAIPSALIFLQPDLGSVLILIILWTGILIVSGIKIRHFLILILCFLLIFIFSWLFLLKDYQKERILSFIVPYEPLGISWSQNQSKIAIGSGSFLGKGLGNGSQTKYGFLPEPHTDFIFAAITEETGFLGASVLLAVFLILLWRILRIAILVSSNFSRLFAVGFAILLFSQIFINIGMNLGILPIIGIPLPLVSYGGSNLISMFIGLGILQNIYLTSAIG